jgi:hypothetical protein
MLRKKPEMLHHDPLLPVDFLLDSTLTAVKDCGYQMHDQIIVRCTSHHTAEECMRTCCLILDSHLLDKSFTNLTCLIH